MREIRFYDKNILPIEITDDQFEKIRKVYGKGGAIEVDGNLIDTKAIQGIFTSDRIKHDETLYPRRQANSLPAERIAGIIEQGTRISSAEGIREAREKLQARLREIKEKKS